MFILKVSFQQYRPRFNQSVCVSGAVLGMGTQGHWPQLKSDWPAEVLLSCHSSALCPRAMIRL